VKIPSSIVTRVGVLAGLAAALAVPALASEEGAQPSIFAGDLGNSLVTLIIFGLVVFLLGKFAWKPVLNLLQQREQTIRDALVEAKREREQADRLLAEYRAQVDHARVEATAIVEEGKRDGEAVRQRIHEEARQEAEQMIARAKREIGLATDDAVKRLYDKTAEIAVSVAGSVIRKELSVEDHRQFVQESLERMKVSKDAWFN
jgi:F-type H+-transporting ATPase subunit b